MSEKNRSSLAREAVASGEISNEFRSRRDERSIFAVNGSASFQRGVEFHDCSLSDSRGIISRRGQNGQSTAMALGHIVIEPSLGQSEITGIGAHRTALT